MSLGEARRAPVTMMESGPGRRHDRRRPRRHAPRHRALQSASTWAARRPRRAHRRRRAAGRRGLCHRRPASTGQPMQLPVVDIVEVGAGGGSIAWCRRRRRPACRPATAPAPIRAPPATAAAATEPTVTDADLVARPHQSTRGFSAATCSSTAAAPKRRSRKLGDKLGLDAVATAALGDRDHRRRAMSLAVRAVSVNKRHRSARDDADRLRRRRPPACRRHRPRDFHSAGRDPETAGHVFGARHADGAVAAGFRAHADRRDWARSIAAARRDAPSPNLREAGRGSAGARRLDGGEFQLRRRSALSSARNTRSRSRSTVPTMLTAIPSARASAFISSTNSAMATPRPSNRSRSSICASSSPCRACRTPSDAGCRSHGGRKAPAAEQTRPVVFADAERPVATRILWRPHLAAGTRSRVPP